MTKYGRWSNASGATLGQDANGESTGLGNEIDLSATWKASANIAISGGYSIFLPGTAAERLGHEDPTHWAFLMMDVTTP